MSGRNFINKIKQQIEILKREIKDKQLIVSNLIDQLENIDNNNQTK